MIFSRPCKPGKKFHLPLKFRGLFSAMRKRIFYLSVNVSGEILPQGQVWFLPSHSRRHPGRDIPGPGTTHNGNDNNVSPCLVFRPFQIIIRLTFFTPSLTAHLIQKFCVNIVKFKSFLKDLLIKQATTKEVIFSTNF
jgi:hypothetical protein